MAIVVALPPEAPEALSPSPPATPVCDMDCEGNYFADKEEDMEIEAFSQRSGSVLCDIFEARGGPASVATSAPTSQDMQRFMLGQERDKLRLWKFSFSDGCLNSLMKPSEEVGSSVVESLVGIAEALLCVAVPPTDNPNAGVESGDGNFSRIKIKETADELRSFMDKGKELVAGVRTAEDIDDLGNSTMSGTIGDGSTGSPSLESQSTAPDDGDEGTPVREVEKPNLLDILKSGVNRLQRLSFAMRLALQKTRQEA